MAPQLLILSNKQNDIDFWQRVAEREGLLAKILVEMKDIVKIIRENPDSLILWDAECETLRGLEQIFADLGLGARVFVVTDGPAKNHPNLFQPPAFSHHLFRRYDENAEFICSQLIKTSLLPQQSNIDRYFRDILTRKSFILTHSGQKQAVVDQIVGIMVHNGVTHRIAEIGADAIDELLMNAIFDAPRNEAGEHYRRKIERHIDFELSPREIVEAEVVIGSELIGFRVVDQFGSLNRDSTVRCLGKNFDVDDYVVSDADPGAGLGISKLMKSALSLAFYVNPGVSTESIALIGNSRSFRKVRESFCFFSVF